MLQNTLMWCAKCGLMRNVSARQRNFAKQSPSELFHYSNYPLNTRASLKQVQHHPIWSMFDKNFKQSQTRANMQPPT